MHLISWRLWVALSCGLALSGDAAAQVCRISAAGLNRNRRVLGPVNVECPGRLHSAPFGNWGVTSNFGRLRDGHQFDGWCHDSDVVFNNGSSGRRCTSDWYQWNSCTDHPDFSAPNCSLYNAADCTEQITATGVNVLGTIEVPVPVGCPADEDGDGEADAGGCADLEFYSAGDNFMSIYELDPVSGDSLIQTLHYPPAPVPLDCDVDACRPNGSSWVAPRGYDDPQDRIVVDAEFAVAVNGGVFDAQGRCSGGPPPPISAVSAAAYRGDVLAPASIATLFGSGLAPRTQVAVSLPLPSVLAGVRVEVVDAGGVSRFAPLLFVSAEQVNFLAPPETAFGRARIRVVAVDGRTLGSARVLIGPVSPGLFSADSSGTGPAAALAVNNRPDGSQSIEPVFECGPGGACRESPVRVANGGALVFFAAGVRGRSSPGAVRILFDGRPGRVLYAGPQNQFEGLDQVNVEPPEALSGAVDVELEVDGLRSNRVTLLLR